MSRTVPPLSSTSSSASLPASSGLSTPEEALSASTVSSAPSSRLSRLSSSSGALSQRTMQSYRTVSLPGLFPGTHLGVLASGMLDKRRDGAVRGGWAKRLFVLSTHSLHYYRKTEDFELFGKERGHVRRRRCCLRGSWWHPGEYASWAISSMTHWRMFGIQVPLADMGYAKLVAPEDAPYGAIEANATAYFCAVLSVRTSCCLYVTGVMESGTDARLVRMCGAEAQIAATLSARRLARVRAELGECAQLRTANRESSRVRAHVVAGSHADVHRCCVQVWLDATDERD